MAKHDVASEAGLSDGDEVTDDLVESTDPGTMAANTTAEEDEAGPGESDSDTDEDTPATGRRKLSPARAAAFVGVPVVVALVALVAYLGYGLQQTQTIKDRDNVFVGVARQGAVNLTTIDWQHADADIQRILDAATGTFYDDFSNRSQPFVQVVKQAQSKSVGTVTEAGLESSSDNEAQVLVAVSVKTTSLAYTDQQPRAWRMRIDVQKVDGGPKVANVQFVP